MRGTLDTFGVVEILQMLSRTRHSGTLHIESPGRLIDVRLVRGLLAETRDSTRAASDAMIGRQLLRRALVDEAQLAEALRLQETAPRPVGTLLVEAGHLAEADLVEVLSRQVAATLVAAKLETAGSFIIVADAETAAADFVTVDPGAVMFDISSLGGEYCMAVELLGGVDSVLVRNTQYSTLPFAPVPMAREELLVLALVDDSRTVADVTTASGLEELTVVNTLGRLVQAGVILVRPGREGRVVDAALQARRESVWEEVNLLLDRFAE
jgi:hypothetical protein